MRFDACATAYDAHALPQQVFAARVANFIAPAPGSEILELGAGTGALTKHLCQAKGVTVRASDSSPSMVSIGRRGAPKADWQVLDAFEGSLPTSRLQVSSGLLQWASDPVAVLERWKAALITGGRMVHAFPCEPCLREWRTLVPHGPVTWRSENEWRRLFESQGLKISRTAVWRDETTMGSGLDLVRGLHRSGVTGRSHLGPGRLRAAIREYDLRYRSPEGVLATWAWMVIESFAY